jgi:deoxycytidylate deaminase
MKPWIQDITLAVASSSEFPVFRHGAVIEAGGRIIVTGVNSPKPRTPNSSFSMHAEIFPLKRLMTILARQGRQHRKFEMYVARIDKKDQPALSKPCPKCMATIIASRAISAVHYTTKTGWKTIEIY